MKKLTLSTLTVLFCLIIFGCKSGDGSFKHSGNDTMRTLGSYVNSSTRQVQSDALYLIAKDSFGFKQVDSNNFKRTWFRDTMVFIPIIITDTTRKDSTGKPHQELKYFPTVRQAVSFQFNLDSNISILNRFIKNNPQIFGADTTKPKK